MIDQVIENQGDIQVNQIPQALTTVISQEAGRSGQGYAPRAACKAIMIKAKPLILALVIGFGSSVYGQPEPGASPSPRRAVSRESRELALASMLEGQRYSWSSLRTRSQATIANNSRLARPLISGPSISNPSLAEAYGDGRIDHRNAAERHRRRQLRLPKAVSIDKNNFEAAIVPASILLEAV